MCNLIIYYLFRFFFLKLILELQLNTLQLEKKPRSHFIFFSTFLTHEIKLVHNTLLTFSF